MPGDGSGRHFYEKPGCGTNRKQKAMLAAAGHEVDERNLLAEPWTERAAAGLFRRHAGRELVQSRPRRGSNPAKSIRPALGPDEALALMLAEPLLIRRPLIEADGRRCAGFDKEPVLSLLGQSENLVGSRAGLLAPCADRPAPRPRTAATKRPAPKKPMPNRAALYHERTKHRFTGYAKGPDTLDWDLQPNPFRTFDGAAARGAAAGAGTDRRPPRADARGRRRLASSVDGAFGLEAIRSGPLGAALQSVERQPPSHRGLCPGRRRRGTRRRAVSLPVRATTRSNKGGATTLRTQVRHAASVDRAVLHSLARSVEIWRARLPLLPA